MSYRIPVWAILLLLTGLSSSRSMADRPNFILIFCDDLGYADVGVYGSELHRTPNIDKLASEGVRFTDFYVTSGVCTPSRASLMTGCYPKRVGMHLNEKGGWVLFPGNQRGLSADETTMAEALKELGYATAIVGKWHLGDQPEFLPTRHGFDQYFGIPFSNDMGETDRPQRPYPPLPLLENETVIEEEPDQRYLTRRYTERAIEFIEQHRDGPFFLYLPHTMPHWPQYASEDFAGKSANGKWGDTVEEIDWSTGQIMAAIKRLELDENTIVMFMSDNGGAMNHGAENQPLRGGKGSTWEGGHRVPFIVRGQGRIPAGQVQHEMAVSFDLLPTLVALAEGELSSDRQIDGKDIAALMRCEEGAQTPHEAYYYYFTGRLDAVRSGKWKLHLNDKRRRTNNNPDGAQDKLQLFDLSADVAESRNLAADHPEVVEELLAWAEQARIDLGDTHTSREGANTRVPGHVEDAKPLTRKR